LIAPGVDELETIGALLGAGASAVKELKASSLHITFMTEAEWRMAGAAGYLQRTDQQFHWENRGYTSFDQFLGELASAKRKNLRKEREAVRAEGVAFEWLTGSDLTEAAWDQFFAFYMDTGGRKWGHPYLTREFFSRVGASMADQILLVMAKRNGRYIAGALNFFGGGTLYGRNWVAPSSYRSCISKLATTRPSSSRLRAGCTRSKPAHKANTSFSVDTCRRRPTAHTMSPTPACAAPLTIISNANAKPSPSTSTTLRTRAVSEASVMRPDFSPWPGLTRLW